MSEKIDYRDFRKQHGGTAKGSVTLPRTKKPVDPPIEPNREIIYKHFIVPLQSDPVAKGRPRVCNNGQRTFTPQKTIDAEAHIARIAKESLQGAIFSGAIRIDLFFAFSIPVSRIKGKHKLSEGDPVVKRPDLDNLIKTVKDALNGVAYEDDSQIVQISAKKLYGYEPYISITIEKFNG